MKEKGYQLPRPSHASKVAIQEAAQSFATQINLTPGAPLEPLVESLGGKIIYVGIDRAKETDGGSIVVEANGQFSVFVSPLTSPLRDRFTIAHELGHFLLHYPLIRAPMKATRYGSNRVEWEANWFAAALLMPEAEFRHVHANLEELEDVAEYFGVSISAAEVRAKALGLID